MATDRLPESVHTLYAELLDQLIRAEAELPIGPLRTGSFVSKLVKGHRYWYLQRVERGQRRQQYIGAESDNLLAWMRSVDDQRQQAAIDSQRRGPISHILRHR